MRGRATCREWERDGLWRTMVRRSGAAFRCQASLRRAGWSAWCDPTIDADGLKHFLGQHHGCGHADNELASGRERNLSSRGGLQAADLVIAQPVEHEGQQFASDRDVGFLLAASSGDGIEVGAEFGAAALFADRLDRRPAHQP